MLLLILIFYNSFIKKKSSLTTIISLITPVLGGAIVDTQDNLFFQGAGSLGV